MSARKRSPRRASRSRSRSRSPKARAPAGVTAYCLRCKASRAMTGVRSSVSTRGTKFLKGKCKTCGTAVCRIVGR